MRMPEQNMHIVAIGGLLKGRRSLPLFQYLLNLSSKTRPAVGFIPTASGDAPRGLRRIGELFGRLNCRLSHLPLFDRTPDLKEFIAAQDVILVGGGNTKSMLAVWREWELPEILQHAWHSGKILAGWSAGAICWFDQGVTDSFADRLRPLDCLGFLPGSCCPHYTAEADRRPAYQALLRQAAIRPGLAIDDGAAIHFRGIQPWRIVAPPGLIGVRTVRFRRGAIEEVPMPLERVELKSRSTSQDRRTSRK
ncbi:MAG: Type 1 glutamine amidotransferase-like domain-containing protein [Deltaproteobacteria bacterium]